MKSVSNLLVFKYRGVLTGVFVSLLFTVVLFSSPLVRVNTIPGAAMLFLGWIFFVLFAIIRVWATLYIGGRKSRELQTDGPYSVCRNPLYLGNFCFTLSSAFFLESLSLLAATVIASYLYARFVIKAEERVLRDAFGKTFDDYVKKTPLIIPHFSNYHARPIVEVHLWALKKEARRMVRASLVPVLAGALLYLRAAPWWPHLFIMP
jgi:protein-S-isoprenylcysteine O-methyltransferase Ste14